ncbi:NfrA family protein [Pseudomonas aegrilactucae]|uniref:Bacteriophage N4 adsorption protein A C-terminal domain-containing protein n=1 Tax=Pseudomonas aegrilactucae TaxID=2854028 RepID=A0A9Q2XKT9_9PSED|nr:tetratricopeptide repeat protein [Pseudomonas aegrilactucae]MBV6288892.1 hypothetical protein [Pseudomonas aegrilactucae]
MSPNTRALLLRAALCSGLLPLPALAAPAQLTGEAWFQADLAERSYANSRFGDALKEVNAALTLRPDVPELHLRKVYTLQKLGRPGDARKAAQAALASGLNDTALQAEARTPAASVASRPARAALTPYQKAYPLAKRAYEALNADRPQDAQRDAEQAFRIDPSQGAWALLWVDALEAQEKWGEASQAASTSIALGAPNRSDLEGRRQAHSRRHAVDCAQRAYLALSQQRNAEAQRLAREAIERAPDVASYRLLLLNTLLQDHDYTAAETVATEALAEDDESTIMRVWRAYLRQLQGHAQAAREDFDAVLAQDWLDEEQRRNVRLIAIDAALADNDSKRAASLLAPLAPDDDAANKRRKQLKPSRRAPQPLNTTLYPMPSMSCTDGFYGTQCELLPADTQPGSQDNATQAYAAYARQDYAEAITQARLAAEQDPGNAELQRLLTTTLSAGNRRQMREAEQQLSAALAQTPQNADLLMQRGYLYQRLRQPGLALQDFRSARRTGKVPGTVVLNEAYAMAAMGDNPSAVRRLRHAIDMDDAGTLDLDENQRFNTRSTIAGLDREWGASATLSYRGARPTTSIENAAQSTAGDSLSNTSELYWRPTQLNNRHGMLDVYGRLTNTLYDEGSRYRATRNVDPCKGSSEPFNGATSTSRSVTGFPSTVGAIGVRYLLADTGLTFGLERRFFIGSATREGDIYPSSNSDRCAAQGTQASYKLGKSAGSWLHYITYGFYRGTELRPDESSWWTTSLYSQLGYLYEDNAADFTLREVDTRGKATEVVGEEKGRLRRQQVFLSNELRFGRSFRLPAASPNLVAFPHVVGAADWSWQKDQAAASEGKASLTRDPRTWSLGAGPGVALRYWFREDHYNAPRSYLDASVQYRFPIGGGNTEQAKGLFMNLTLSY